MPRIHKTIELTNEEEQYLINLLSKGVYSSRKLRRARILLKNHEKYNPVIIAEMESCCVPTVYNILKRYRQEGIESALNEKLRPCDHRRKINQKIEGEITAIACSKPPAGHHRWTIRMITDKYVEMTSEEPLSHETVRTVLKKVS